MKAERIHTSRAPEDNGINAGNFSQAAKVGDTIWVGGTLAIDQERQVVVDESPTAAIRQAYSNLVAILEEAGATSEDVVMLHALLVDLDDLDVLNEVQAEFFAEPHPPRSTFEVAGLPHGPVELTATAIVGRS